MLPGTALLWIFNGNNAGGHKARKAECKKIAVGSILPHDATNRPPWESLPSFHGGRLMNVRPKRRRRFPEKMHSAKRRLPECASSCGCNVSKPESLQPLRLIVSQSGNATPLKDQLPAGPLLKECTKSSSQKKQDNFFWEPIFLGDMCFLRNLLLLFSFRNSSLRVRLRPSRLRLASGLRSFRAVFAASPLGPDGRPGPWRPRHTPGRESVR